MARLPIPGSDSGNWGTLLNEYLSQVHKGDGSLKDNVVTNASLAPNAVDATIIQDSSVDTILLSDAAVTAPKIATSASPSTGQVLSFDGTSLSWATPSSAGSVPDGSSSTKGLIRLTGDLSGTADSPTVPGLAGKEATIAAGTISQYWRGDKTWQALDKAAVGLTNLDNTSDLNKPVSTATQTALNAKLSNATLTTKGDLPVASAPSTVSRLAVGSNNQVLTADSAQGVGMKWADVTDADAIHKGDFVLNVKDYGAVGDDSTDDTAAIQAAIDDAIPGQTVFLPLGKYRTTAPLILHPGVTLRGSHGNHLDNSGYVQTETYIKPRATFVGDACILMVDKEIGGYADNSCEQRIYDLTLDGGALTGNTIDGIQAHGWVHGVVIRDVAIRFFPNRGIATTYYTRADTSIVNSFSWRIQRVMADTNGGYGYTFTSLTDATLIDLEAIGNGKAGFFIAIAGNSHFIGCRAEWNNFSGYQIDSSGSYGTCMFTSCSTDRNRQNGVLVTGNGTQPILFNGLMLKRDGRNNGAGGAGYAGFAATSVTAPIIINGMTVSPGVDDGGSGVNSPQYGFSATSASYISISGAFLHGATAGWFDGGGNAVIRKAPNVGERSGTWNAPTNILKNDWGTDNSSTFTASMNTANATAIAITSSASNTGTPLQTFTTTASNDRLISSIVTGDSVYRFNVLSGGYHEWGSGTVARDTTLYRSAASTLRTDGAFIGQTITASGLAGVTAASRYVGATASGAPISGTFVVGDFVIDRTGAVWICTTAGTPGVWTSLSSGGGSGLPVGLTGATAATRYVGGTNSGAPVSGTFAVGDFVIDQTADIWICTTAGTPGVWQALKQPETYLDTQLMTNGEETANRLMCAASASVSSGTLHLTYFTARKSESITKLMVSIDSTAGSGLTYGALGIYSIDGSGNGTLVANTASDTGGFSPTFSLYTPNLLATWSKAAGTQYALAILCTGTTMPSLTARPGNATLFGSQSPRLTGQITGQTSLPASFTNGSVANSGSFFFGAAKP